MSEKCEAVYKNLESIASTDEQRYGTVQWAKQNCSNDEWLRQQVEELRYLTPPAVRKRYAPILVDALKSYGYQFSDKNVIFSTKTEDEITVTLNNLDLIDTNSSTCDFETYVDESGPHLRAVVPMEEVSATDYNIRNHQGGGLNSFWYVGYDKNKNYQLRPDWIADDFDNEIPAVCRAQTFTIPDNYLPAGTVGKLVSVDLQIENNGTTGSNWGSPLYVQVFRTEKRTVEKTYWDSATLSNKSYNPKQYEDVWWPVGNPNEALATAVFQPNKINPSWHNFLFDKAIQVKNGEHYALVFSSPLSHWEHCPRIGGWGRNCANDKYSGGDAFLSENNGRSWIRYGRNDLQVPAYKYGQLTPLDFAFQLHIDKSTSGRDTDTEYYMYLKPILTNPITSFKISGSYSGETVQEQNEDEIFLRFEYKVPGQDEWRPIDGGSWEYLNTSSNMLFIRAVMKTLVSGDTPGIERLIVDLHMELPKEMYVRTHFYNPKLSPMLGAGLWGRIYAPLELSPKDENINASVEIVQDREVTEHFTIITVSDLDGYLELLDSDGEPILDPDEITGCDDDSRAEYLYDNPSVIHKLKQYNIYIKPYTNEDEVTYYLSFDGGLNEDDEQIITGLELTHHPAYPMLECLLQPNGGDQVVSYGEWHDYIVDYDADIINIDETVLENMSSGALALMYNPVFIQDLSPEEVGGHVDEDTGLDVEGLILDYFKEKMIINEYNIESRSVQLKAAPVDPVRSVLLNETELREDIDFSVDYDNHKLIFPIVNNDNESSVLKVNDKLTVVYTPQLEDTSISIAYRCKRDDTNHQCTIKPNFFEYKV